MKELVLSYDPAVTRQLSKQQRPSFVRWLEACFDELCKAGLQCSDRIALILQNQPGLLCSHPYNAERVENLLLTLWRQSLLQLLWVQAGLSQRVHRHKDRPVKVSLLPLFLTS